MASIGTLAAIVTANASGLNAGLNAAGKQVTGFVGSLKAAFAPLAVIGAAMGFGGLVSGLVGMIKEQMEAVDSTLKLADAMGITTESLVGLQYAAELSNVSNEDLGKGLTKLGKLSGEAAGGNKEATAKLAELGIEASKFVNLPLDEQFTQVADAISALPQGPEQIAAAMSVFGKSGATLLPLLAEGTEGIKAMRVEAEQFGLTFSRDQGVAVERANDAVTRMSSVFTGIARTAAIELAPVVEGIAVTFTDWVKESGGVKPIVQSIVNTLIDGFLAVLKVVSTIIKGVKEVVKIATNSEGAGGLFAVATAGTGLGTLVSGFQNLTGDNKSKVVPLLSADEEKLAKAKGELLAAKLAKGFGKDIDLKPYEDAVNELSKVEQQAAELKDPFEAAIDNIQAMRDRLHGAFEATNDATDAQAQLKRVMQEAIAAAGEMTEQLTFQNATFGKSKEEVEIYKLTMKGATEATFANVRAAIAERDILQELGTITGAAALNVFDELAMKQYLLEEAFFSGAISIEGATAALAKLNDEIEKTATSKINKIIADTQSPLQKFESGFGELQGLLARGLPPDAFALAGAGLFDQLESTIPKAQITFPAAVEQGSQAALDTIAKIERQREIGAEDPQKRVERVLQQSKELQQRQLDNAIALLKAIEAQANPIEVDDF